ncbi:MAG TPA: hypothetical protein VMS76_02695 [Planctomycetota bacterium]|nr:hypothetical protein [Planctomycetota bacterium]
MSACLTLHAAHPKDFLRSLALELSNRRAIRAPLALEVPQALASALVATALSEREEPRIDEVDVRLEQDEIRLEARVRLPGRAWPPRPPIDTRVRFAATDVRIERGDPGALLFRVSEPLSFSSSLAETAAGAAGLFGKAKLLPLRIDELRRKGAALRLDLGVLLERLPPGAAAILADVRVQALALTPGRARLELGFAEPPVDGGQPASDGR